MKFPWESECSTSIDANMAKLQNYSNHIKSAQNTMHGTCKFLNLLHYIILVYSLSAQPLFPPTKKCWVDVGLGMRLEWENALCTSSCKHILHAMPFFVGIFPQCQPVCTIKHPYNGFTAGPIWSIISTMHNIANEFNRQCMTFIDNHASLFNYDIIRKPI